MRHSTLPQKQMHPILRKPFSAALSRAGATAEMMEFCPSFLLGKWAVLRS